MTDVTPSDPNEQTPPPAAPPAAGPGGNPPPPSAAPPAAGPGGNPPPPPAAPTYGQPPAGAPPAAGAPYGYAPVPVDSQGRPLAEWWQRLVAFIIDAFIIGTVYWILTAIVVASSVGSNSFTGFGIKYWIVELIVGLGGVAYFAFLEGSARGQSVGQMALGIAVRDSETGGPINVQRAGIRMVILYPWMVLICIPFVGWILGAIASIWTLVCGLSPLWNPGQKGYHDIAQKTTVIKVR